MTNSEQAVVTSLSQYLELVSGLCHSWREPERLARPWFRGHGNVEWRLLPAAYRGTWAHDYENEQIRDFRLGALGILGREIHSPREWYFVMQHHGVPTRLLDWTESALVGLYFSVRRDSTKVKKLIGGRVDASWITNTCTIRLSRAFNYAGDPIEKGLAGLNAVSGADGKWYAFRVREMEKYLRTVYGAPQIEVTENDPKKLRAAVSGHRGVIQFNVLGWSDATGHMDIWDGSRVRFSEYFAQAQGVNLWRCPL